jgi:hypothetical protein
MRPRREREEMPGGTLRVDSKPRAGARLKAKVSLYGWKVWRRGLRHSGLGSIRMQRIRERTFEARLFASVAREPEEG